jgi:hypothetical protein
LSLSSKWLNEPLSRTEIIELSLDWAVRTVDVSYHFLLYRKRDIPDNVVTDANVITIELSDNATSNYNILLEKIQAELTDEKISAQDVLIISLENFLDVQEDIDASLSDDNEEVDSTIMLPDKELLMGLTELIFAKRGELENDVLHKISLLLLGYKHTKE